MSQGQLGPWSSYARRERAGVRASAADVSVTPYAHDAKEFRYPRVCGAAGRHRWTPLREQTRPARRYGNAAAIFVDVGMAGRAPAEYVDAPMWENVLGTLLVPIKSANDFVSFNQIRNAAISGCGSRPFAPAPYPFLSPCPEFSSA